VDLEIPSPKPSIPIPSFRLFRQSVDQNEGLFATILPGADSIEKAVQWGRHMKKAPRDRHQEGAGDDKDTIALELAWVEKKMELGHTDRIAGHKEERPGNLGNVALTRPNTRGE
jgi:hypothetical protein